MSQAKTNFAATLETYRLLVEESKRRALKTIVFIAEDRDHAFSLEDRLNADFARAHVTIYTMAGSPFWSTAELNALKRRVTEGVYHGPVIVVMDRELVAHGAHAQAICDHATVTATAPKF